MNPKILHEDAHIIVCVKPAGTPTQSANIRTPDMVSLLKNHIGQPYLAVIHRLDQPVEGILVFAKTPFAAKELSRELQQNRFGKYYLARLAGHPKKNADTLEHYLVKDGRNNASHTAAPGTKDAKKAILHYEIKEQTEDTSLVKIHLETGRHHQIRVQMAAIGCPIVGDTKYNTDNDINNSKILCLCAYKLTLRHPKTKETISYEITPKFLTP